jgi:hypothetical protein
MEAVTSNAMGEVLRRALLLLVTADVASTVEQPLLQCAMQLLMMVDVVSTVVE